MRPHSILIPVFLFAAAIRLIYIATLHGDASFFAEADTHAYWSEGGQLWRTLSTSTDRMPLYPLFLAACRALFGDAPRAAALLQALLGAGTCAMIARLGLFVSRPAGIAAGLLAACSATLVVYSAQILTDTLALFMLTAAFSTQPRTSCNGRHWRWLPPPGLRPVSHSGCAPGSHFCCRRWPP